MKLQQTALREVLSICEVDVLPLDHCATLSLEVYGSGDGLHAPFCSGEIDLVGGVGGAPWDLVIA